MTARTCLNCDGDLYAGRKQHRADGYVCRECQKSPPVQLRVYLSLARGAGYSFERAWDFAWERIRWPHDTAHRLEWKELLENPMQVGAWRSAYLNEPPVKRRQLAPGRLLAA